ncbi:MAG: hypothetical protein A2158_02545 [Chloroflexi bacterium RBG_13_46_14]|nr:MAG: hypothetical protein A2158_02545 [Chloroflexi bacterium RBG_13_46_14]
MSCNGPSLETILESESVQPEDVLAEMPVYPGAEAVTTGESAFEPFSTPRALQPEIRPFDIVYETISDQYTVQAEANKVLNWYKNKLSGKGYRLYTEMKYNGPGGYDVHNIGVYRPEQLLISVEIHVYAMLDATIFSVVVSRDTTTSLEPPEPPLPDDIDSIEINYTGDQDNTSGKIETITDAGDIRRLVDIINSLPLRHYGPPGAINSRPFNMIFHSLSMGKIPLTYELGFEHYAEVRINNRAEYQDNDGKLLNEVQRLLDI